MSTGTDAPAARSALGKVRRDSSSILARAVERARVDLRPVEVGTVTQVSEAIARIAGLSEIRAEELVQLPSGVHGIAASLGRDSVGVILLGAGAHLRSGDEARRTGRVADVPVGESFLGRVVDALGNPLDEGGPIRARTRLPIERQAPAILDRDPVSVPLQTGLKAVDALVPIGRGQRELVVGDRQTGKTTVAIDTILNQRDVICVYCAIGQRASAVARVVDELRRKGAMERSIVVVAGGEGPPGLQFVAPYAATTMAEFFVERGEDVLIVYDDLTRHARAYRELSLLLRRPPGREAYPGDIFYVHSRLLERATHLASSRGGGSLTALPVVETQAQNLTAYVPTNLISITDGQIVLSSDLFQKGLLPAVDVGLSVSRVGGKAQLPAYRAVAGPLRLAYAQFQELETFARFGTRLDPETRGRLERGRRVREILKQGRGRPLAVAEQITALLAVTEGLLDHVELDRIAEVERLACEAVRTELPDVCDAIEHGAELDTGDRARVLDTVRRHVRTEGAA